MGAVLKPFHQYLVPARTPCVQICTGWWCQGGSGATSQWARPGQVMPKHARLIGHCQAAARCTPGFHVLLHAAAKQLPLQLAHSPRLQPDSNCCEGCTLQSCCAGPICAINCPKALPDLSLSQGHGVGPRYRLLHGPALAGCCPKGLLQMCCARRQRLRLKVLQYSSSKRPFSQGQRRGTTDGNNRLSAGPI
jgi:hypothetical protein